MSTLYAPRISDAVIAEACLVAAREWQTEAVTARPTALDESDTEAYVWVFEVVGRHADGWDLFGREMLVAVTV